MGAAEDYQAEDYEDYEDYQGDLKASLAGGVYRYLCFCLHFNHCIRLCHPNKIDLLTYLLGHFS